MRINLLMKTWKDIGMCSTDFEENANSMKTCIPLNNIIDLMNANHLNAAIQYILVRNFRSTYIVPCITVRGRIATKLDYTHCIAVQNDELKW